METLVISSMRLVLPKLKTEFVIFSDLHAHNFTYGADRVNIPYRSGLYNSRLADTVAVLDEILEYTKTNGMETAVFCGDLFHRRTSLSTDVRHVIHDRLRLFDDESINLHILMGNHDMGDRRGYVHNLAGLDALEYISVYDNGPALHRGDIDFLFVPYVDNREEAQAHLKLVGEWTDRDTPSILFGHLGMQGARVGSDYVLISDGDVEVSDVPHEKFAACFFGHFHEHQRLFDNGWFVGATHQHNWGDVDGSRGFLHVKVYEDGAVEFEQISTRAPRFVVYEEGQKRPTMKHNDFVRYITEDPYQDKEELKAKWKIKNLEIIAKTVHQDEEFTLDVNRLSPGQILDEWIDFKAPDLDKEELLEMGRDILKEVGL